MVENYYKLKGRKISIVILLLLFSVLSIYGQRDITGTVVSAEDNQPLIGATVSVKGTTVGTITDVNGEYSIQANNADILVVSYVGFATQEIPVNDRTIINVSLEVSAMGLEELVVVGYGSQREKDLTSAIVTVGGDDIERTPASDAMQALQGKVAGVQIVSSGAPGSSPTVRVRGIGSLPGFGNSDPLYVIDGVFFDDISFLNPSDIQSITVLKDASAKAIYGVRAANGVILVTTKSGTYNQAPEVIYNGYYGVRRAQNVLKMANSEQFVRYVNETGDPADISFIENAMQRYGRSRVNPDVPNVNTDWYKEVLKAGPITNHSITINGGGERVKYSVGASYFNEEGLLKVINNNYERTNFRTKIDFRATDRLTVGGNVNISNATRFNAPNSVWFSTYFAVPVLPVYDDTAITTARPEPIANAQNLGYRGTQNPFFSLHYNNDRQKIGGVLSNFYFDFDILPEKLSFRMSYNLAYGNVNTRNVNFAHNTGQSANINSLYRQGITSFDQIWDNILTYEESFGNHNITLMGGYTFRSETQEGIFAQATEIQGLNREQEELWFMSGPDRVAVGLINQDNVGDIGGREFGSSYIGRLAYNFDDRYLLYGTFRRDGTNKFQAKWGNFFTLGAGWVISEEGFFNVPYVDFLKLRGSWGELGNDKIQPAEGQPTRDAIFMAINDIRRQGITLDNAFDLVTQWETTEEVNIGLSARMLGGSLSLEADYYVADTKDAVTLLLVPGQRAIIRRSVASIRNSGLEMALNYSGQITNNLTFSVGGNFATLHNEVLDLGPGPGYLDAGQAEFRQRNIVGEAIESYFGYEVEGIFQSNQDIENSGYTEEFVSNFNIEPGDFFFKDQDGNGVIDSDDRVILGNYLPDITYGADLRITYRNLSLSAFFQGQAGHEILNRKRGEIIWTTDTNIDADLADNMWRGNGTSNEYPSAAGIRKGYNQNFSDYFLEDGSYFQIQNVQLSYRIDRSELSGVPTPEVTIRLSAERPLTLFQYNGFTPEVPNGIDRQTYPIPAIYTAGVTVKF